MRRIDAIAIAFGVFLFGGVVFLGLHFVGLSDNDAGVWSQAVLMLGLLLWLGSYGLRVVTQRMTLNQQLEDYKTAVMRKQLEEMSPTELASLQAEIESSKSPGVGKEKS